MATPLITNDFLSNPIMPGIISDKTAALIADQGNRLSQDIELRSTTAEAQFKAPQITQLYSSAYQKIVSGDMTGFADMQKARSLAIGNPILMSTLNSADQIAGHLANEWLVTNKSTTSSADILDRQATVADINASNTEYHQANYAHEREKLAIAKNDEAALRAWQIKDANDRQLIAAGDTSIQLTPKPEPSSLPPPPTKRTPTRYKGGVPAGPITSYAEPDLPANPDSPLFNKTDDTAKNGLPVDWIIGMEGFRPKPYKDGKQTSIGNGTVATPEDIANNKSITPDEARARLVSELSTHAARVDNAAKQVGLTLTPTQREAVISYDYNTGRGVSAIQASKGDTSAIANSILNGPVTQNGTVLQGLVKRRKEEYNRFLSSSTPNTGTSVNPVEVRRAEPALPLLNPVPQIGESLQPDVAMTGTASSQSGMYSGMTGAVPTASLPGISAPTSASVPAAPTSMAAAVPKEMQQGQPLVNQIPFGDAVITYTKPKPDLTKKVLSDKSGATATIEYPKEDQLLAGAVNIIKDQSPSFAQFAVDAGRAGQQASFKLVGEEGKLQVYHAVRTDGTVLSNNRMDALGQKAVLDKDKQLQPEPVKFLKAKDSKIPSDPKDEGEMNVVDAWNLVSALKQKTGFEMKFPKKTPPPLSETDAKQYNDFLEGQIAQKKLTREQANNDRKLVGLQPRDYEGETATVNSKREQDRIDAELTSRGIFPTRPDKVNEEIGVKKEIEDATNEIKYLESQLDAMKGETSDINKARKLQARVLQLKDKLPDLRRKLYSVTPVDYTSTF